MSLFISSVFTYDEDAGNYIQAVEGASGDNQALEPATRKAINNFVIGCKQDGIWTAIKASCILSGARTLAGALVPLVGTAPTNVGPFVSGDYNRKTGLVGDANTKYLNANRNNNAETSQNSKHMSVYVSTFPSSNAFARLIGGAVTGNYTDIVRNNSATSVSIQINSATSFSVSGVGGAGLYAASRSSATNVDFRVGGVSGFNASTTSALPSSGDSTLFGTGSGVRSSNGRYAFYSIGESLDLARLDARVTDLINAFAVTIP